MQVMSVEILHFVIYRYLQYIPKKNLCVLLAENYRFLKYCHLLLHNKYYVNMIWMKNLA